MSRQIMVGGVAVGGGAPVSIQSMCNTVTENVEATAQQILRLEQAGCEIIRVAVPTEEAARAIPAIKARIHIPLVADIHFDYKLALLCVQGGIDKIRINPGNIGAKERVRAVADACRERGIPIRIGVNGPGEASGADVGIAGGNGEGLLFARGKILRKVPQEQLVDALFQEIDKL